MLQGRVETGFAFGRLLIVCDQGNVMHSTSFRLLCFLTIRIIFITTLS